MREKNFDRRAIAAKLGEIEDELKRAGLWQSEPLPDEQYDFSQAFARDTMSFIQWLQFVFVARVKEILESGGEFPATSEVARQAFKEFVMYPAEDETRTKNLLKRLEEFDRLF